jgi:hypothetical protein
MANYDKLRDHHKNQLLTVLGHYMSQELRQKLMLECPAAYNAWCEDEIVAVIRTSDNTRIVEGTIPVVRATFGKGGITFTPEPPKVEADGEYNPC